MVDTYKGPEKASLKIMDHDDAKTSRSAQALTVRRATAEGWTLGRETNSLYSKINELFRRSSCSRYRFERPTCPFAGSLASRCVRSEELRFDSVVAVNPGKYDVVLWSSDGEAVSTQPLVPRRFSSIGQRGSPAEIDTTAVGKHRMTQEESTF